ncbi:hypothetical protein N7532_002935 [Penicillium argentinense]|uniref:Uncharacterized protein n=1 Tax=Penicillium argentinense TaxID=1131581 RepID=A0A9W9G1B9_9EURO|nr:uncharacterized protein N7532_002935 [Penicillium argentinense]KAJ5110290.1 hypothetical protein N7532_002935 [Penicillium argentinense]
MVGSREMGREQIESLDDYIRFCDELLRWVPKVSTKGDELLRKILVFYWVLNQPTIRRFQTPIIPKNANVDLSWLSRWMVRFAREQGQFLDTPQSATAIDTFYRNESYKESAHLWRSPIGGWKSFNHWFARCWKDIDTARPLAAPGDPDIIVSTADAVFQGIWPIIDGNVSFKLKGVKLDWPISTLLQTTDFSWSHGHFIHSFLAPSFYHRQHAPVSGTVIEAKIIQNQVFFQVEKREIGNIRRQALKPTLKPQTSQDTSGVKQEGLLSSRPKTTGKSQYYL